MSGQNLINARQLHRESIVIDAHCDTLGRVLEKQRRLGECSTIGQFDLPRAIEGGLTAELMATFFKPERVGGGVRQTLQFADVYFEELAAYSDLAMQALSAEDIVCAKEMGKVALVLSMEGAEGLEGDLRVLRMCYRLGLRVLGVTWNRRNEAADGLDELGAGGGLTRFGVSLVKECNSLGILVDVAHLTPAGVRDVLELSDAPIIASHANCYALWPHPRNLTDAQLEAIAKKGGVVGVVPAPPFLGDDKMISRLSLLVDHVEHMVSVMGDEGVGLGMDFDGIGDARTVGIEDASKFPNLTEEMVARGFSRKIISNVLGGNLLRVFRQVL